MNKILSKRFFSDNVAELIVEAPLIARSRRAGHFVIIRVDAQSERIPLTIAGADIEKGTITLVVQQVGASTHKLLAMNVGDSLHDIVGPLGRATRIENYGTVVCACGGVGAAPMLPIAEALKKAGNRVITVLAARNKDLLILQDELAQWSDEVIIMTDDGSAGQQGVVTVGVEQVINREKVDKCITIGPAIMMKFVALTTQKYNIPTEASLNTIMVDGTGMCGACRVTVDGKTKFVCVDGPEFDAHGVDWNEMLSRMKSYKAEETEAMEAYKAGLNLSDTAKRRQKRRQRNGIDSKGRYSVTLRRNPERPCGYSACTDAGTATRSASQESARRGQPRSDLRTGHHRKPSLSELQEPDLCSRLSGEYQHPGFHQKVGDRRRTRCRCGHQRIVFSARSMRSCLPTRETM